MDDKTALTDTVVALYRNGTSPFFRFGSGPDAKNSATMIADLDQGGLGLPDRDYYLKTDEKSVEIRKQYVAHIQKMLQLAGASAEDAAKQAQAVMAMETELAKASLDRVARRDPAEDVSQDDAPRTGCARLRLCVGRSSSKRRARPTCNR